MELQTWREIYNRTTPQDVGRREKWLEPTFKSFEAMRDTYLGISIDEIIEVRGIEGVLHQIIQETGAIDSLPEDKRALIDARAEILRKFPLNRNSQRLWDLFEPSPALGPEG